MEEHELPAWAAEMTGQDLTWLKARLEQEPEKAEEILEDHRERVQTELYQTYRRVLNGERLPEKDIVPPDVPVESDEPMGDWFDRLEETRTTRGEFYADVKQIYTEQWEEICRDFERKPNDFANAWYYLDNHPAFWAFRGNGGTEPPAERIHYSNLMHEYGIMRCVHIIVTRVNPATGRVEDVEDGAEDPNILTQVWIELGRHGWPGQEHSPHEPVCVGETYHRDSVYHDYLLDCGGNSMEEAVIEAAVYVHTAYGNDRRVCDKDDEPCEVCFKEPEE